MAVRKSGRQNREKDLSRSKFLEIRRLMSMERWNVGIQVKISCNSAVVIEISVIRKCETSVFKQMSVRVSTAFTAFTADSERCLFRLYSIVVYLTASFLAFWCSGLVVKFWCHAGLGLLLDFFFACCEVSSSAHGGNMDMEYSRYSMIVRLEPVTVEEEWEWFRKKKNPWKIQEKNLEDRQCELSVFQKGYTIFD